MAAGYSPEEIAENWKRVRASGRKWLLGLILILAGSLYVVGYGRGRLAEYRANAAECAQGPPSPHKRN